MSDPTCTPDNPCNRVAGDGQYVRGRDCRACFVRHRDKDRMAGISAPQPKKPCKGCGGGSVAVLTAAPLVSVPAPPPLTIAPRRTRAVVTCVGGEKCLALWSLSGPLMRAYADRLDADLVVLEYVPCPDWSMSIKFGLWRALELYERAIFADADVVFREGCVDLFERFPSDTLAAFDDLPFVLRDWPDGIAAYQRTRESQDMKRSPVRQYLNTGLMVAARQHAHLFAPPVKPIPKAHCSEQDLWNARIADAGVRVSLMTDSEHHQWWVHGGMNHAQDSAVLHFSGMGDAETRLATMRPYCPQI